MLKEESLKQNLKNQIKEFGWKDAAKLVNGPKNLAKNAFNDDPMEFHNMFNDLDVVQHEENSDYTLYRCEKGNNMMIYSKKNKSVYIKYEDIWSFLEIGFGLGLYEIENLTQGWLGESYNLREVTTSYI